MTQWILFAVLLAAVLAAVLWPLIRPRAVTASRADYDIEVYADQLRELERDVERGIIDPEQAAAARLEIERRLLAASRAADREQDTATASRKLILAAILAVAITGATSALYLDIGSPGLPNLPFAERPPAPADNQQLAELRDRVAAVEARLASEPENADIWRDLGMLRMATGDPDGAVEALAHATVLSNGRADIASAYGEALTGAAEGMVTPQAQQVFREVIEKDSENPRARFFLALAHYQAGRREVALDQWSALAKDAPADAPWLPVVNDRVRRTASELGADVAAYLPTRPGPSQDDVAAAQNLSPDEQAEMIRGMVGRLAARLEETPGDVEGWRRLGQSYDVLQEPARAANAYSRALELEPDHAETMLRAALASARAEDTDTALTLFRQLHDRLPPDSDAYRLVGDAIKRLGPAKPSQ